MMDIGVDEFWKAFLKDSNKGEDIKYSDCFHFELTEKLAEELLKLVLCGKKKATCSSLSSYESEGIPIPKKGDYSIVTHWNGNPECIIETTDVKVMPFKDITFDICRMEGEDDSLESWRNGHKRFFESEGKEIGYIFTEDMQVVFEIFNVVYKKH